MLSEQLNHALNDQMNHEFQAAHSYTAMASYFSHLGYAGFANFYLVQAREERFHAMKFYHFLVSMGVRPLLKGLASPNNEFESPLDVAEKSLEQEKEVTRNIYELSDMALEEKEHATINFLKWFVDEQIEEEEMFKNVIQKLKSIEVGSDFFMTMDKEFAERSFSEQD